MYLSDRDIDHAIKKGHLIVDPYTPNVPLQHIGPSSIDVHLGPIQQAKIWDMPKVRRNLSAAGGEPKIYLGDFNHKQFSTDYQRTPPPYDPAGDDLVSLNGEEVIIRPNGFLLWQTRETLGTPENGPRYICFIDGKSTRARTGLVVHLTAPTIQAGWSGKVVLEIKNLGPLTFVLRPGDVIAQVTVALITSCPDRTQTEAGSVTQGQVDATGTPNS